MEQNIRLTSKRYDENFGLNHDDTLIYDPTLYTKLIDKLLYLTITRPDISFSVQHLSQFMQNPKKSHLDSVFRMIRYTTNQPGLGVLLSSDTDTKLIAFCDSD